MVGWGDRRRLYNKAKVEKRMSKALGLGFHHVVHPRPEKGKKDEEPLFVLMSLKIWLEWIYTTTSARCATKYIV
jgi:hypothetical protein